MKLPEAAWDPDTEKTICQPLSDLTPGTAIPLGPLPLAVSFGLFNEYVLPFLPSHPSLTLLVAQLPSAGSDALRIRPLHILHHHRALLDKIKPSESRQRIPSRSEQSEFSRPAEAVYRSRASSRGGTTLHSRFCVIYCFLVFVFFLLSIDDGTTD